MRKLFVGVCLALLSIGVVAAADALLVSEEESFEDFAVSFRSTKDPGRLVLSYADVSRVPLDVSGSRQSVRITEDREWELTDSVDTALRPFVDDMEVVQEHTEVNGDTALVAIRASTASGEHNGYFTFRRLNGHWYIAGVRTT